MPFRQGRLTLYIWRLVATRLAGTFALLLGVYVLIDAIESASSARLTFGALAAAYPFKLPIVVAHVAPLACALSVLLAFGALRRRGEWDAAAAAGIGPLGLLGGLVAIPFAVAVAVLPLVNAFAPWSLARFEARTSAPAADPSGSWWDRDAIALVRWRDARGGPRREVEIERAGDGTVVSWRGPCGEGAPCSWRRGDGWSSGGAAPATAGERTPARTPRPGSYGLVGASLASSEIRVLSRELEEHGRSADALRAELALRNAVAVGAGLVPALALVLAFALGTVRDTRLVGLGIATAAAYWLALATAWNGAALGALSSFWVSLGVPALFAACTVAVSLRIAAGATAR